MPALYETLTAWYHLLDPLEDHEDEARELSDLLIQAGAEPGGALLELGCGAGNNAFFLSRDWRCTLSDRSPQMLALSRAKNPGCEHALGDMRSLRLDRLFDVVLVHDAVCYLLSEAELAETAQTAFAHTRPGGVALFAPDCLVEGFCEWTEESEASDALRTLRTLSWTWDPDPGDTVYAVEYALMMREGGEVRVVHDHHEEGLFPRSTWERVLGEAGFRVRVVEREEPDPNGLGYTRLVFLGLREGAEPGATR